MGFVLGGLSAAALVAGVAVALVNDAPAPGAFAPAEVPRSPGWALRAAVRAIEGGDPQRAEELLSEVAERAPIIADHADLLRLRLYLDEGRTADAVALGNAWSHPDSPLEPEVMTALGDTQLALGDEPAARAAWAQALGDTDDDGRRAALRANLARSLARSGETEAAAKAWMDVWTRHPLAPEAGEADEALGAFDIALGRETRTPRNLRRRGDTLFRLRHNEDALAAYESALAADDIGTSDRRRAQNKRAETLFRLRRYTQAREAYAKLPRTQEIAVQQARARARAGDVLGAAEDLENLGKQPGIPGARASLLAALLIEDEDQATRARSLYTRVVRGAPGSSYAAAARWRLGWAAYRAGELDEAAVQLEPLAARAQALAGLRARYWYARTLERLGREEAAESFAAIGREFPFSYYGWRAAARAGDVAAMPVPEGNFEPGEIALAPRDVARPAILLEAELRAEAVAELHRLSLRAEGVDDRLALAQLYQEAGEFHRAQRLITSAYNETLARGPVAARLDMWWHAWPAPYDDEVRAATNGAPPEPWLVYAIMREESGYRPAVLSVSGARGLLQLMPSTAERVARSVELTEFEPDDLYLPGVNIRLGSSYLRQLLERFPGHRSAAIGSYNAGPEAVERWIDDSILEDDEWVEAIPYEQTRTYVKRVLRSAHVYRVLH